MDQGAGYLQRQVGYGDAGMKSKVDDRYMARVYLAQAKATKHRSWAFTLLGWAANCRRQAMAELPRQRELLP